MPTLVPTPTRVTAVGHPPKQIDEIIGRVNTGDAGISVARMRSPAGWQEPGQRPEFREITVVLAGALHVEHERPSGDGGPPRRETLVVSAGQAVITEPGEWIRYGTPEGAEYIAICTPAFAPETVHRDAE
ncbi:MAG: hypothetical protein RIT45_1027 [Pseudomonadota bacterium]